MCDLIRSDLVMFVKVRAVSEGSNRLGRGSNRKETGMCGTNLCTDVPYRVSVVDGGGGALSGVSVINRAPRS